MKLPALKSGPQSTGKTNAFNISVSVQAANATEAADMQQAIQSFVAHFSVAEMKSAAAKLRNATNRKMIKTFL